MIDVIEQYDAERLQKLIQLTKIRNVSLDELMIHCNMYGKYILQIYKRGWNGDTTKC
jgi:hypothetical protein